MQIQFVLLLSFAFCNAHDNDGNQDVHVNENIKEYVGRELALFKEDFIANTKASLEQEIREKLDKEWREREANLFVEIIEFKKQLEMDTVRAYIMCLLSVK